MKHNPLVTILLASTIFLFSMDSELANPPRLDEQGELCYGQRELYYMYRSARIASGLTPAESSDCAQSSQKMPSFLEEYIETHKKADLDFYRGYHNKKTEDQIKKHNQTVFKNRKKS